MSILCLPSINAYTQGEKSPGLCVVFITWRDVEGKESHQGRKVSPDNLNASAKLCLKKVSTYAT